MHQEHSQSRIYINICKRYISITMYYSKNKSNSYKRYIAIASKEIASCIYTMSKDSIVEGKIILSCSDLDAKKVESSDKTKREVSLSCKYM